MFNMESMYIDRRSAPIMYLIVFLLNLAIILQLNGLIFLKKKKILNIYFCFNSLNRIQLQSEQFYRPSDFGDVLQEACHEYLTWVTELIYNHSNLPSNKLFAHSVIMANVQFGNSSKIVLNFF